MTSYERAKIFVNHDTVRCPQRCVKIALGRHKESKRAHSLVSFRVKDGELYLRTERPIIF